MALRHKERPGILPVAGPDMIILGGGDGALAPAPIGRGFFASMFPPLIHLNLTLCHDQGWQGDPERQVVDRCCRRRANHMNEVALIGGVQGGGRHRHHRFDGFIDGLLDLDITVLVPPQYGNREENQQDSQRDSDQGAADPFDEADLLSLGIGGIVGQRGEPRFCRSNRPTSSPSARFLGAVVGFSMSSLKCRAGRMILSNRDGYSAGSHECEEFFLKT